ncbi:MAG TPA: permease, partial [Chloroflexota bacterium]
MDLAETRAEKLLEPLIGSPAAAARPGQPGLLGSGARSQSVLAIAALIATLVVAAALRRSWDAVGLDAVRGQVSTVATVFLGIFLEALPFLLLGVFAAATIELFVTDELLARLLPRRPLAAALVGALLGLLFPICECGIVAVSRRLLAKGAPLPLAIALMLAAPVVNPIVIASTWIAFGHMPWLVVGRIVLVFVVAVMVALVFGRHDQPSDLLVGARAPERQHADHAHDHAHDHGRGRLRALLDHASDEFFAMVKYLVLGALLAAVLQTVVPRAALLATGQDPALSVLTLMGLAVLLSICSTVDAFVALSFAGTFSAGAILGFLAFGPLVDIKSVLMYGLVLRR